jgi:hypothetical protein
MELGGAYIRADGHADHTRFAAMAAVNADAMARSDAVAHHVIPHTSVWAWLNLDPSQLLVEWQSPCPPDRAASLSASPKARS